MVSSLKKQIPCLFLNAFLTQDERISPKVIFTIVLKHMNVIWLGYNLRLYKRKVHNASAVNSAKHGMQGATFLAVCFCVYPQTFHSHIIHPRTKVTAKAKNLTWFFSLEQE